MSRGHVTPHVLIFPFPLQGHMPPMLNLAQLLSSSDIYVSFVNTEHIYHRLLCASHTLERYSTLSNFRFLTIPDGLHKDDPRSFVGFLDIEESMRTKCREEYKKLLGEVDGWPHVTCILADGLLPLAFEVPAEMDLPTMIVRTSSASSVLAYYSTQELINRGEIPFEDEGNLDKAIHGVQGMESFLRRRDLPSLIKQAKSTNDRALQFVIRTSNYLTRSRALIFNTVEAIEALALSHIHSICPIIYNVGPLHAVLKSNYASLWKEDQTCLLWLDKQPPKSVTYVSFGSITVMSKHDLLEFWHGLVNSKHPFLWVIRPDLVKGEVISNEKLMSELKESTKMKGCFVAWAPQKEVLAHPSVGCFLTHSGWNSTLESIAAGIPMICWPFLGDQMVNSRFVSQVWKIGMDMKDLSGRTIVEKMVRDVMDGDEADEMRKRVNDMAKLITESIEEEGSSCMDLKRLIQHIKALSVQPR